MKRKKKKVLSLILTATILLSTACADSNTSQGDQSGVVGDTSGGVTESTGSNMILENTPNRVDDKLPECQPANMGDDLSQWKYNRIMKGAYGYYYTMFPWEDEPNIDEKQVLYYYDTASGQSIPLCAKPQCMHDGNEFCAATGGNYDRILYNCLYNGYIYKLCNEYIEKDGIGLHSLKLMRADMQGNELSHICELFTYGIHIEIENVVCHYGKMFVNIVKQDEQAKTKHIYIIDLSSGEVKEIEVPEAKKYDSYPYMTADGDYLYYAAEDVTWGKPQTWVKDDVDTVMHRYNIKTGETEIVSGLPKIYASFTVNDGIIYYTTVDRVNNTYSLFAYDTASGNTKTFIDNRAETYLDPKHLSDGGFKPVILTDRKYLYLMMGGDSGYGSISEIEHKMYIYDLNGKELYKGVPYIDEGYEGFQEFSFSAIDGEIYIYYCVSESSETLPEDNITALYTIKTEELIKGSKNWQKLYKTSDSTGGM